MNKYITLILLPIFFVNLNAFENPYELLDLDTTASPELISKRCRDLRAANHPDKGGTQDLYISINNACDAIQHNDNTFHRAHDIPNCSNWGDGCTCQDGQHGTCRYDSLDLNNILLNTLHCDCSSSQKAYSHTKPEQSTSCHNSFDPCTCTDGSSGFCYHNAENKLACLCPFKNFKSYKETHSYSQDAQSDDSTEDQHLNHKDGCVEAGDTCTCSNTGLDGTCSADSFINPELYCHCKPHKKEQADFNDFNFENFAKNFNESAREPEKMNPQTLYVLSRTISSPVYSLPLERSLTPLLGHTTVNNSYYSYLALVPFAQSDSSYFSDNNFNYHEKHKGGLLIKSRQNFDNIWIDFTTALEARTLELNSKQDYTQLHINTNSIVFSDFLITVGLEFFVTEFFYINLKGICGIFNPRTNLIEAPLIRVSHNSVGLQSDAFYTFYENNETICNIVGNFRWLNFIKRSINIYEDNLFRLFNNDTKLNKCDISPGNFFDILIAIDLASGCYRQHRFQAGYDATFNVGEHIESSNFGIIAPEIFTINPSTHARHTLFCSYNYNFTIGNIPFSLGIGGSTIFVPNEDVKALIWGLISISF